MEVGYAMVPKTIMSQKRGGVFKRTSRGSMLYYQPLGEHTSGNVHIHYILHPPPSYHNSNKVPALTKSISSCFSNNVGLFFSHNEESRVRYFGPNIVVSPWCHQCLGLFP